jgi:hypothetical protein
MGELKRLPSEYRELYVQMEITLSSIEMRKFVVGELQHLHSRGESTVVAH